MENIALIGIANLFPGSDNTDTFWQQLLNKTDSRTRVTADNMGVDPDSYLGKKGDADKFYSMHGGYISNFKFDPSGFNLSSTYLNELDDLTKWGLFVTKQALIDSGYWKSPKLENCGIILGNLSFPTKSSNHLFLPLYGVIVENAFKSLLNNNFQLANFTKSKTVHCDNALISGYPSAVLAKGAGLGSTSYSLDAACASSCYSVKLACDELHTGKSDLMLAGAVSAADPFFINMGFSIFQAFPDNNMHAPLDKRSKGLFAGEGAGMMVLKRYSDAVRDGDKIYSIIKGGALSNDGKGEFVLSPNTKGQVLAFERAYKDAEIDPLDVDYIECHATGTPKGDKVELNSMDTFFSKYHTDADSNKPLLGTAKSNLGHLLTAAGMPGMLKTVYALNEGVIPATIGLIDPLSSKDNFFTGEQMPTQTVKFGKTNKPRIAGVSVFGFGGSNAHLIFEQPSVQNEQTYKNSNELNAAEPLSIIGMDSHFGNIDNLEKLEDLIKRNGNNFSILPELRWRSMEKDPILMQSLNLKQAPIGGYIKDFDIDFLKFKIPPNPKDCLIPQQLLLMKVADKAAIDAKLVTGSNVAVLVSMGTELELHQYRGRVNLSTQIEQSLNEQGVTLSAQQKELLINIAKDSMGSSAQLNQYTSFIGNIMASRISALWDFSGPAFTVSCEENSVFRSIEIANNLFQTSEVEAVIIAGVDLSGSLENISLRHRFGDVSLDPTHLGKDSNKHNWIVGEGAGAIVVKPKSRAVNSYADIEATAFSLGSDHSSLIKASKKALNRANLKAEEIGAIEAFSSGFKNDDLVEKRAIAELYPNAKVSSIKNNIGHTFNASGIASIIKSALLLNSYRGEEEKTRIGINGLGRDCNCAHLILSSTSNIHIAGKSNAPDKLSLIKPVSLGGASIYDSIVGSKEIQTQLFSETKTAFNIDLKNVTDPNNLKPLIIEKKNKGELNLTNESIDQKPQTIQKEFNIPLNKALKLQELKTHRAFLDSRFQAQLQLEKLIELQAGITNNGSIVKSTKTILPVKSATNLSSHFDLRTVKKVLPVPSLNRAKPKLVEQFNKPANIIFNAKDLVEFAEGKIENVFGKEYKIIDSYPIRVRLPTTDYLLVSRVTALDARINEYKKSSMTTEYDIPVDAPYLIDGQIPWCVAVESGQCDLMLISYIGIDLQNKGERVYRLLDCELTFLEEMAFGGQTLRYEIHIDSFAKNGEQLLFFFHYDCFVGNKKVLIMRNGCAGFFTDKELEDGKGVLLTQKEKLELNNATKSYFKPLIKNSKKSFDHNEMLQLVNSDQNSSFETNNLLSEANPSLKFSSIKFLMIERVTKIDINGGHWGLGLLEGEKDLAPNDWYFPCHFKSDQVMAGSLMSEGCGQLAMFLMLYLGMSIDSKNARFQPMKGESQTVRCRGQVLPQHNTLRYKMEVTELGMSPNPFIKANFDILLDGKVVVDFKNLCIEIIDQEISAKELHVKEITTPETNSKAPLMKIESDHSAPINKGVIPLKHFAAPYKNRDNVTPDTTPYMPWHLFEFATGDISKCFGPDFDVYKNPERVPPRTPCGQLQLVTKVIEVKGKRLDFKNPSSCVSEYVVPRDAWYFANNSHDNWIPYSMIMEIALQPNGFISACMGATLKYPEKDLFFRNLDGSGELLKKVDLRGKTIINRSKLLSTSMAGGAIIQSFTFELLVDEELFYKGSAVFGYFSAESLKDQLGIDNGKISYPWFFDQNTNNLIVEHFDLKDKGSQFFNAPKSKPHYKLAGGQLNFVDKVSIVEKGGKDSIAYIYGEKQIDPSDWFFQFHFHQDPVMPGSLGVEAIIELMQTYAIKNDLGKQFKNPRFIAPLTKVIWKYRGQITPLNKTMNIDIHITDIIKTASEVRLIGDANLSKDGLRIYEVKDLVLSLIDA